MITIKKYLRCDNKEKTSGYVSISFYVKREKVSFSTKIACEVKNWNEKICYVKASDRDASDKNLIIDKILSRINDVIVKYRLRNKELTRAGFWRMYNRPDDFENFFKFCDDYQRKIGVYTELVTLQQHRTALNKLKDFIPDLHFDDFTLELLTTFYHNVLRRTVCENTAFKNMTHIRKYVNAAVKAGYMDENPFSEFPIKRTKANYTYLEEVEVQRLMDLYRSGDLAEKYHKTLQFFLYECLSSQHVGDALPMQLEQFNENTFSYYRVKLRHSKPELVTVPISGSLRDHIKSIVGFRKHGKIFESMPADQTMNRFLKEICKRDDVKISKNISHKTGRHTFATFYLDKTKDLNSLRDILGHSDIRETLIYAHVLESSKMKSIDCFDVFQEK